MLIQSAVIQNAAMLFVRYYGYFYYQLNYLLWMIPAIILTIIAQSKVKAAYAKYSRIPNSHGMTGEMAARAVLQAHGITDVRIEPIAGKMTDHYSPNEKVIRLSEGVISTASIAAVGIAAHEAGHAVQHAEGYVPNKIRSSLIPVANISSRLATPLILIGFLLPVGISGTVTMIGVIAYAVAVLVYLVTLPVEFDASRRALATIKSGYMLEQSEYDGAKSVLTAAAMTYVASALTALLSFLRLLLIAMSRSRRN